MSNIDQLKKQVVSLGMVFRNKYAEWPDYVIFGSKERRIIEQYNLSLMKPSEIASGKNAVAKDFMGFKVIQSTEHEYFAVSNHLIDDAQYNQVTKLEMGASDLFEGENKNTFLGIPLEKVTTTQGDRYGIVLHNTERNPTIDTYGELNQAFDFFNQKLFDGSLPKCLITMQREKRTLGYFAKKRFVNRDGDSMDELAMNPSYFGVRSIAETLSTLVHEMCHVWQFHHGTPSRGGYHNREWGKKMQDIGLMPSDTGLPEGKQVGQSMSHYIMENGPFELACKDLLSTEFSLSWYDRFPPITEEEATQISKRKTPSYPEALRSIEDDVDPSILEFKEPRTSDSEEGDGGIEKPVNRSNRLKYRCPTCKVQVWGKPDLKLLCGEDDCKSAVFEAVE